MVQYGWRFSYFTDDLYNSLEGVLAVRLGKVLQGDGLVEAVEHLDVVAKVKVI